MPSISHQTLLLWTVRKMTADGFLVVACDGSVPLGGLWKGLPSSVEIVNRRPDAWAIAPSTGELAIGEAKTWQDIDTAHTRRQLRVFGKLLDHSRGTACRLYIAVPRSTAYTLDRVLQDVGLLAARHIVRLHIPDCFLAEERDACA
jgi:hypothetical protein